MGTVVVMAFLIFLLLVLKGPGAGTNSNGPAPKRPFNPDPMPMSPRPPRGNESTEHYLKATDSIVVGNQLYGRRQYEWLKRHGHIPEEK